MKTFTLRFSKRDFRHFRMLFVGLTLFFGQFSAYAQIQEDTSFTFKRLTYLPEELNEISGMVYYGNGNILAINDGGNPAELTEFSPVNGEILNSYPLKNAHNTDWEAIAMDDQGWIYIADIGNNANTRMDLCIYMVHKDSIENPETAIRKISFHYADQTSFPPPPDSMWYDAESALILNYGRSMSADSLWIITKNRTEPFDGKMYVYSLPLNEGDMVVAHLQNAKKYTEGKIKELEWITDAFYDRTDGGHGIMALSSSRTFRAFYEVVQGRPKSWWREENPFLNYSNLGMIQQFEAITSLGWSAYNKYWVTCEASPFGPAALYELHYRWVANGITPQTNQTSLFDLSYLPNGDVQVNYHGKFNLQLYSMDGKLLDEFEGKEAVLISADQLKQRPLLIHLMTEGKSLSRLLH